MSRNKRRKPGHLFHTAAEDVKHAKPDSPSAPAREQQNSPSYRLAFDDKDFLLAEEQRGVRLMLELNKPDYLLKQRGIQHTVVIFGSARTPSPERMADVMTTHGLTAVQIEARRQQAYYYNQARHLAAMITERSTCEDCPQLHVVTGGGPGIMEAANRGAADVGGESIGMNIVLPFEQYPNPWITPEFCFQFHYFAMRKMHFLLRARALVVFPGGFGTLDELFEALTLVQTKKIAPLPILIFGREFWKRLLDLDYLLDQGMISPQDLNLFHYVDSADEAWAIIRESLQE